MQIGKVSEIAYKRSVKKKLSSDLEGVTPGVDAAQLSLEDITVVMSSNCILKWFQGCEEYYLQKSMNQLYEKGGIPLYVQLQINIPVDYEEKKLGKIIRNINAATDKKELTICFCRAYVGKVESPIVHITVIGKKDENIYKDMLDRRKVRPGMQVVMAGSIAIGGTAVLSEKYRERLLEKFNPGFVNRCIDLKNITDIEKIVKIAAKNGTISIHAVSDGGVFNAIWELASSAGIGICVDIKKIPVLQETIEVAEVFDYNPYLMDGTGAALIVCDDGERVVSALKENGFCVNIIGQLTEGKDRIAVNGTEKRYLEPPRGDEIYRFL